MKKLRKLTNDELLNVSSVIDTPSEGVVGTDVIDPNLLFSYSSLTDGSRTTDEKSLSVSATWLSAIT